MTSDQNPLPNALHGVVGSARVKHIPSGQIILYEGDIPTEVFILKSGVIKIYDIDEDGNEKILHIVKPPALVPFAFFSSLKAPLQWFYTALTDCDLYVLPADKLQQIVKENGKIGQLLTNGFSDDVHELLVRLSSLNKTNVKDKICAVLKFLVVCHATIRRSGWYRVNFPASHQLIADLAGITRESAAMVMKDLQDEKIIRNPRLTILEINKSKLIKS